MKYNRNRKQIQVSNSLWLLICEVRNTYIVIYMLHSVQSSRWQGGENFKKRGRKLNTLTPKCQIILKRHGNLLSISSEGGEHLHTPHKRYRPSEFTTVVSVPDRPYRQTESPSRPTNPDRRYRPCVARRPEKCS